MPASRVSEPDLRGAARASGDNTCRNRDTSSVVNRVGLIFAVEAQIVRPRRRSPGSRCTRMRGTRDAVPQTMTRLPSSTRIEPRGGVKGTLAEENPIAIRHGSEHLTGSVSTVPHPDAVVLIANDRGCSRHSPAARELSATLRREGFATVLVDLLLPPEAGARECAAWTELAIDELARRVFSARSWIASQPELQGLPIVLFGQGAGAAAALVSAGAQPCGVSAVIARDGSPDTVGLALESIRAPALLMVETASGRVAQCLRAHARLTCEKAITLLPARVSPESCVRIAVSWIRSRLPPRAVSSRSGIVNRERFAESAG
jgi:putative phosphoribosyl transferase